MESRGASRTPTHLVVPVFAALAFLACWPAPAAAQMLGRLPAGMSPDSVDFTPSELYVQITFPSVTPALRELQASGGRLLARTFERQDTTGKYVLLDLNRTAERELWLPLPTDAETEARVSGTAFFKLVGDRFYYLRQDEASNRWEVHMAIVPDEGGKGR